MRRLVFGTVFAALLLPAPASATSPVRTSEQQAEAGRRATLLVERSNTRENITLWREMLLKPQQFPECNCGLDREQMTAAWAAAVRQTFDVDLITRDIAATLATELSLDELASLNSFDDTPLGKRLTTALRPRPPGDDGTQMMRLSAAKQQLARAPERRAAIARIAAASDSLESTVNALVATATATAHGMVAVIPPGRPRPAAEEIDAQVATLRPMYHAMLSGVMQAAMADTHRDLTDRELRDFARWLETPLARKVNRLAQAAFIRALDRRMLDVGRAFGRKLNARDI